jgi:hypothetical protein
MLWFLWQQFEVVQPLRARPPEWPFNDATRDLREKKSPPQQSAEEQPPNPTAKG